MSKQESNGSDITAKINMDGQTAIGLTLEFSNGRTLHLSGSDISGEIAEMAMFHGLKQKLVDAAAMSRDRNTGKAATIDAKFEAVSAVYERLLAGQWNKPREGASNGTLLAQAMVRLTGRTMEDVKAQLAKLSDADKAKLEKTSSVALEILAIKRERIEAGDDGEDGDSILSGFMS